MINESKEIRRNPAWPKLEIVTYQLISIFCYRDSASISLYELGPIKNYNAQERSDNCTTIFLLVTYLLRAYLEFYWYFIHSEESFLGSFYNILLNLLSPIGKNIWKLSISPYCSNLECKPARKWPPRSRALGMTTGRLSSRLLFSSFRRRQMADEARVGRRSCNVPSTPEKSTGGPAFRNNWRIRKRK